jgi:phosphate transport system substrate-binding protein
MFDRLHAIRSLGSRAALGGLILASLAVAACGSGTSSTSGTPGTNSSLTACHVSSTDLVTGVTSSGTATAVAGLTGKKLVIDGSSALQPLFLAAAPEFDTANGTQTTVNSGGSGQGLKDANAGAVNIGMSDVFAQQKEPTPGAYSSLVDHQVAVVIFTLAVNKDLAGTVQNLTTAQIQAIFSGQDTNWSAVGGPSEPIVTISRPTTSGTRATFKQYVMGSATESTTGTADNTGAVAQEIAQTPGAIGYIATSFALKSPNDIAPICIDGGKPTLTDINAGNYHFWNIEHAYTKGPATGAAKAFLQYILSDQVQKNDLLKLDFAQISSVTSAAIATHTPSGAPAPESLS